MAIYAYIYSGYPESKDRKYYVCNYRRGNAYTYQVVPQLQREFDRRGYENKTRIGVERFKELRRAGHLYTSKREQKRRPLYGEPAGDPDDGFGLLREWLGGGVWPGGVDWRGLGRRVREHLEAGEALPEDVRRLGEQVERDEESFAACYERLRRRHLEAVWFHLWPGLPDELDLEGRRRWRRSESPPDGGEWRLHEVLRETRPTPEPLDEQVCLERLSESVGEGYLGDWEAVFAQLGPEETWYEELESTGGERMRVPGETLYDLQWPLVEQLAGLQLHHATAPALEVDSPAPLHARFHAGAEVALVVRLEEYLALGDRQGLAAELRREAAGGRLEGWSEAGVEALARLLCDPATGRANPSAPTAEVVSELCAWEFDEAIRRRLDEQRPGGATWRYSRLHDEAVLSAGSVSREAIGPARDLVESVLDAEGIAADREAWLGGGSSDVPLVISDLKVPAEPGAPLPLSAPERRRVEAAMERARGGEADGSERATLQSAYERSADLRFRTMAAPTFRADVRRLLAALALTEFEEELWRGWLEADSRA